MSEGGIRKLVDFLRQNGLLIIEIYCYSGYVRFIKVVHTNGVLFMIHISKEFELTMDPDKLSTVTLKRVSVLDVSNHVAPPCDEYMSITLEDGKRYVHNAKDLLNTRYDQMIVLQQSNIIRSLEQMKRIKACFKETFFKVVIEVDDYLLCLNSSQQIELFNTEKTVDQTFYIVCELEYIYKNIGPIFDHVETVQKKFFGILDGIQQHHYRQVKNELVSDFVHVNQRCHDTKERMKKTFADATGLLKTTFDKEKELEDVLVKLNSSSSNTSHPFRDMDRLGKKREVEQDLRKLSEIKTTVLEKIVSMDRSVKHIYLQIDNLDYQVSLALMDMRNELEKLIA